MWYARVDSNHRPFTPEPKMTGMKHKRSCGGGCRLATTKLCRCSERASGLRSRNGLTTFWRRFRSPLSGHRKPTCHIPEWRIISTPDLGRSHWLFDCGSDRDVPAPPPEEACPDHDVGGTCCKRTGKAEYGSSGIPGVAADAECGSSEEVGGGQPLFWSGVPSQSQKVFSGRTTSRGRSSRISKRQRRSIRAT